MRALCLLLCPVILSADSLILKSGQQVDGATSNGGSGHFCLVL
jgi:hypothetical protein